MNGLELAEQYYELYGKQLMMQFPQLKGRVAVGLVGQGSECFGFDDEISVDHDFGPAFCMWLNQHDYQMYGQALQAAYQALPGIIPGVWEQKRKTGSQGQGRVGVLEMSSFYYTLLGTDHLPATNEEWLALPQERLAVVTNGRVFEDTLGEFTAFRNGLLAYYPEDVRLKKMAAGAAIMAQSGQYNYPRAMQRGEYIAAELALGEFIRSTISMVYLLNQKYAPFYKWMHRGMKELTQLSEVGDMLMLLTDITDSKQCWGVSEQKNRESEAEQHGEEQRNEASGAEQHRDEQSHSMMDRKLLIIEAVCQVIAQELQREKLTHVSDSYLELHAQELQQSIHDPKLRSMHILLG